MPSIEAEIADLDNVSLSSLKVADAFQKQALLFSTPEALRKYLHDHPDADKAKHKVEKSEHSGPAKDKPSGEHGEKHEDHDDDHGDHDDEHEKKPLPEKLKSWGSRALSALKNAPASVQKFVGDEGFRRKTLQDAHEALTKAPEKIVKNALKTVKDEVKEFKTAGTAIGKLVKGGEISKHEKHALKTVGFHIALTAAATALTATGPLAGAALFGKSLVRHVAMKAVSNALGHMHVLDELGHIGHGIAHIMSKLAAEGKGDTDEVMAHFFIAAVAKELKGVKDEDIRKLLEEGGEDEEKKPEGKTAAVGDLRDIAGRLERPLMDYVRLATRLDEHFAFEGGANVWSTPASDEAVVRMDHLSNTITDVAYEGLDALRFAGADERDPRYEALLLTVPDFSTRSLGGVRSRDEAGRPAKRYTTQTLRASLARLTRESRDLLGSYRTFVSYASSG